MIANTLNTLTDPELVQVIANAQALLHQRSEKRKSDAMEQIRQIAASVQINVSFENGRKLKAAKTVLRAGDRYINPSDPRESYIVGKGKPPGWFAALRERGKLPAPCPADTAVAKP